jgi:hypothetical protein
MHSKILYGLLLSILFCGTAQAQQESILEAPEDWGSEIIPFPLSFAESIPFKGFEELRFAPGWSDSESPQFWSYAFVWYIDMESPMTVDMLSTRFNAYYDGLMGTNGNPADTASNGEILDQTSTVFEQTEEGFSGEMRVYDAFHTFDYLTLNIIVQEMMCHDDNKQMIFCTISPKDFNHEVWADFDAVQWTVECH